ncbi:hypothetical protein [Streptomyces longhuiensis]|uniref:hypothetical protein n=1 Tax=Streptomyces longhuiensis TaxID=2880933 RepID=UPI001D0A9B77|nr:hypothetical protein [Streptomyces longhuiensis]UDM05451.1 hypothetical protein LGI35_45170 [Streptomyces longhuiensis]
MGRGGEQSVPLGHSSWASYCGAECGISRAQAYRLLDVAYALAAIHDAVTAGTEVSRTWILFVDDQLS